MDGPTEHKPSNPIPVQNLPQNVQLLSTTTTILIRMRRSSRETKPIPVVHIISRIGGRVKPRPLPSTDKFCYCCGSSPSYSSSSTTNTTLQFSLFVLVHNLFAPPWRDNEHFYVGAFFPKVLYIFTQFGAPTVLMLPHSLLLSLHRRVATYCTHPPLPWHLVVWVDGRTASWSASHKDTELLTGWLEQSGNVVAHRSCGGERVSLQTQLESHIRTNDCIEMVSMYPPLPLPSIRPSVQPPARCRLFRRINSAARQQKQRGRTGRPCAPPPVFDSTRLLHEANTENRKGKSSCSSVCDFSV